MFFFSSCFPCTLATPLRTPILFPPSARNQTSAVLSPQGSGAGASQDPSTANAAREGGNPEAGEGEERRDMDETEGGGKVCRALLSGVSMICVVGHLCCCVCYHY